MNTVRTGWRFPKRLAVLTASVIGLFAIGTWLLSEGDLPLPTAPGTSAEFDAQLQALDEQYSFVFAEENRLVLTRTDGSVTRVLLDLPTFMGYAEAEAGDVQLSPDGNRLLVPVHTGPWHLHENRQLLVLDVRTGHAERVAVPTEQYGFDMGMGNNSLCNWVDNASFVISLTYYPPEGAHLFQKKFLIYQLSALSAPQEFDIGAARPTFYSPNNYTFMYVGADEPPSESRVRVLANGQVRAGTEEEIAIFDKLLLGEGPNGPHAVSMERVSKGESLFGTDPNWNRYDIYFGKQWVRRSEALVEQTPAWEADLKLYIWYEWKTEFGSQTYLSDAAGRYRSWYHGRFIGNVSSELRDVKLTTSQ